MVTANQLIIIPVCASLLTACGLAQMKQQAQKCTKDRESLLIVPPEPPAGDVSGSWKCVSQGSEGSTREALEIVQHGATATITMRDQYNNSSIGDARIGGNVIAWRYASNGVSMRFGIDPSGRLLDGAWLSDVDDCAPHRETCTRR